MTFPAGLFQLRHTFPNRLFFTTALDRKCFVTHCIIPKDDFKLTTCQIFIFVNLTCGKNSWVAAIKFFIDI
jgi:hypothetical protein